MPLGLISFKVEVGTAGDTAEVTVYLSKPEPNDATWYKYDSINGWQDYSDYATFSADRRSVMLELKDGSFGDADGTENGIIVDPSGFDTVSDNNNIGTDPPEGLGLGFCFINTAAIILQWNSILRYCVDWV